jgi:hypothetical protein
MKAELRDQITKWFRGQGIQADPGYNSVKINRDSMCASKFSSNKGLPEEETYPNVLAAINKEFAVTGERRFDWFGKTDDDLFLDVMELGRK